MACPLGRVFPCNVPTPCLPAFLEGAEGASGLLLCWGDPFLLIPWTLTWDLLGSN